MSTRPRQHHRPRSASLNRIARSERIKRIMIGCVSCAASVREWQGVSIQMASVKHYDTVCYVYDVGVRVVNIMVLAFWRVELHKLSDIYVGNMIAR